MTPEQARELFSAASEGDLSPEEQTEFERVLSDQPTLQKEYEAFRQELSTFRDRLRKGRAIASESVDVTEQVQERLRVQSGGKFYRDRFAGRRARDARRTFWITATVLLVLVAVVIALSFGGALVIDGSD